MYEHVLKKIIVKGDEVFLEITDFQDVYVPVTVVIEKRDRTGVIRSRREINIPRLLSLI